MRRGIFLSLLSFAILAPSALLAQDGPDVGGDVRLRTEYKRPFDYFTADGGEPTGDDGTFMRTRIHFDWELANNVAVFLQLQDSRVWGVDSVGDNADADIDMRQAYLSLNNLQEMESLSFLDGHDVDLHIGRIALPTFGDGYIVSSNEWNNVGPIAWDGFWLDSSFGGDDFQVDVDFLWADLANNNPPGAPAGPAEGAVFYFLQAGTDDIDLVGGDLYYAAYKGDFGALTDLDMNIFGIRLYSQLDDTVEGLDIVLEYAMQGGEQGANDFDADFMVIRGTYELPVGDGLNPIVGIGYSAASGDGDSTDTDIESWTSPLHYDHAHLGHYDLFDNSNISDFFITSQITIADSVDVHLDLHFLSLDEEVDGLYTIFAGQQAGAATNDDDLGTEIDLYAIWSCGENLDFQAGWSIFQPGDGIEDLTGGFDDNGNFFYVQMTVPFGKND